MCVFLTLCFGSDLRIDAVLVSDCVVVVVVVVARSDLNVASSTWAQVLARARSIIDRTMSSAEEIHSARAEQDRSAMDIVELDNQIAELTARMNEIKAEYAATVRWMVLLKQVTVHMSVMRSIF